MKIAIQGIKGSYHHEAVEKYYNGNDIELVECETFSRLAMVVANGEADSALMAIENTIAGALLPNYALISKHNLKVVGEQYLSIQHQLMAMSGITIDQIREVRSHPMALLQCDRFLENNLNWRVVEAIDTALTAYDIAEKKLVSVAAIASKQAAKEYGLEILQSDIQTFPDNFTRFFVIERKPRIIEGFDKASFRFVTSHHRGALSKVLNEIAAVKINMDKIQSVPIIDKPWKYSFHVDITFETITQYEQMHRAIAPIITELEIIGEYKSGKK